MSMKALVLEEYERLMIRDVDIPSPGASEVLVRIHSVGICGSDVHGYDGTSGRRVPPVIMGHEAAGTIATIGDDVKGWSVADRVTFDSALYSLDDWYSRRGMYNLSDGRRVFGVSCDEYRMNGAFAEYVSVPAHLLYRLPDSVDFDEAALTEPLAVALHAVSLTPIGIGDTVAVIGAGVIGLLTVASLAHRGCKNIIVADISKPRLAAAKEFGATHLVNGQEGDDLVTCCAECTDGRGADAVLEAVGLESTIQTGLAAVRRGGTLTVMGNISRQVVIPLQRIVAGQITLQGSCAISNEYPAAISLLDAGTIPTDRLISARVPLDDGPLMFERLHRRDPELLKVILHP